MSRRLDALFAKRVLGRTFRWLCGCFGPGHVDGCPGVEDMPHYTTDLSAAWEGVEACGFGSLMHSDNPAAWDRGEPYLSLVNKGCDKPNARSLPPNTGVLGEGRAATPALAVVLACLRACGVSEEEIAAASGEPTTAYLVRKYVEKL